MATKKPGNGAGPTADGETMRVCPKSPPGTSEAVTISGSELISYTEEYIKRQIEENWVDLDDKYRAFADEYVYGGYDHRDAARIVGFPESRGIRLIRDPLIRAYINSLQEEQRIRRLVTEDFIDAQLADLFEKAVGNEKVPLVTSKGDEFTAPKFHGNLAFQILQERAKLNGVRPDEDDDESIFAQVLRKAIGKQK